MKNQRAPRLAGAAAGLVMAACLALSTAHAMDAGAPPPAEREAILRTIDAYIDGGRAGSGEVMKQAFHEGATIYTATAGGPIQLLFDLVDGKPAAKDIPYTVANLEVAEDIAMARVEIDNWGGVRYTDMFTLVKTGDGWKIVSKVSHKY